MINIRFANFFRLRSIRIVHTTAVAGFGEDNVARYDAWRPSYSEDTIHKVYGIIDHNKKKKDLCICEVGAGTGLFTSSIINYDVTRNLNYYAIEPSDFFRNFLEKKQIPAVHVKSGTGEHIPIESGISDCVIVAQAFHWMANIDSLVEMRRVLKQSSPLVLVWNGFDDSVDWIRKVENDIIIPTYTSDVPRYQTGHWEIPFNTPTVQGLFTPLQRQYSNQVKIGKMDVVINRVLSQSTVASLPEEQREIIRSNTIGLLSTHPDTRRLVETNGDFEFRYKTLIAYAYAI